MGGSPDYSYIWPQPDYIHQLVFGELMWFSKTPKGSRVSESVSELIGLSTLLVFVSLYKLAYCMKGYHL